MSGTARKSITVLLRMDNTTAVAYVNKLGGNSVSKLDTFWLSQNLGSLEDILGL